MIIIGLVILILGFLGGIGSGYLLWKPKKPVIGLPVYFPVVVKVPKYIEKPIPYKIIIPPITEYRYISYDDSMRLVSMVDSLITLVNKENGKETLYIKSKFLTSFPTAPKLVNLDLQMDSISLTLLNIQAQLYKKVFPLNQFEYKYRFDGTNMSTVTLSQKWGVPKVSKWKFSVFGYLGSDVIDYPTFYPFLSVEGGVSFSRIKLAVEPKLTISKYPTIGINAKIGVRLWEWPN